MRTNQLLQVTDKIGRCQGRQRGSALIMATFVLCLITSIGVALLFLTQNEVKMSGADVLSKQAFYLAESGLEDGRRSLFITNFKGSFNDDLIAAAGVDLTMQFDPDTVGVTYDAQGNVTGVTGTGDDLALVPPLQFGGSKGIQGAYITFLTNDPLDLPANPLNDTNDRVMITGIGVSGGKSVEIVQAIVEKQSLIPSAPPAAITLLGPTPTFDGADSSAKTFEGEDCSGAGQPGLFVPTVGVVGPAAEVSAETDWTTNPIFQSGPYTDQQTVVDLISADPLVTIPLAPEWQDCEAMQKMVEQMRRQADVICPDGTETGKDCILPPPTLDMIIFGDGDLSIGKDSPNQGVLVVTGALTRSGMESWYGMIFVVGEGTYITKGGGNGTVSGSILIADIAGPDGIYGNSDDCTGGPDNDGFGVAEYIESGGGNALIQYCSADIAAVEPIVPNYPIVEFLQH